MKAPMLLALAALGRVFDFRSPSPPGAFAHACDSRRLKPRTSARTITMDSMRYYLDYPHESGIQETRTKGLHGICCCPGRRGWYSFGRGQHHLGPRAESEGAPSRSEKHRHSLTLLCVR